MEVDMGEIGVMELHAR